MEYPKSLKLGDTIYITAPSAGANLEKIFLAMENLKKFGFKIECTDNVFTNRKLVSSTADIRATEFLKLINNKKVKYIISARGGDFLMDIIPLIDKHKKEIKENVKWIQGYSDTSLLLYYITTNFSIATLHFENISAYAMNKFEENLIDGLNILLNNNIFIANSFDKYQVKELNKGLDGYNLTKNTAYKSLYNNKEEEFEGVLIGGCIDTLAQLFGTKYDNTINFCKQFKGMIWYLDNYSLSVPNLYRILFQAKEIGWFNNAKGFLFGRSLAKKIEEDFTYEDALSVLKDLDVPVIYDVDIGHIPPQFAIINGAYGKFSYKNKKGVLEQKRIV